MTRRMARPRRPSSSGMRPERLSEGVVLARMATEVTVLSLFLSNRYVILDNTSVSCYYCRELATLFRPFRDHSSGLWSRLLSPFPSCTYELQIPQPLCFDIHPKCPGCVPPPPRFAAGFTLCRQRRTPCD